jgi:hypothetical protein
VIVEPDAKWGMRIGLWVLIVALALMPLALIFGWSQE